MSFQRKFHQITKRKSLENQRPPQVNKIDEASNTVEIIERAMHEIEDSYHQWDSDFDKWKTEWRMHLKELSFENVLAGVYGYDYIRPDTTKTEEHEFHIDSMSSVENEFDFSSDSISISSAAEFARFD